MDYSNFLKFYEDNRQELLLTDGLRPAKSVTRTIITSVEKFVEWYKATGNTFMSYETIASDICNLTDSGKSTIEDNIRNMKEIQFLIQIGNTKNYQFTRNFINFVYSEISLEDYIINNLSKIDSLENINMFYNYILTTLREAVIKGCVTLYPDSAEKFHNAVTDKVTRIKILNEIYNLYGFKSRTSEPNDDDYTPNINYRILSTVRLLGLLEESGNNEYGFQTFVLTDKAKKLLETIDKNISNYGKINTVVEINESIKTTDTSPTQQSETVETHTQQTIDIVDNPEQVVSTITDVSNEPTTDFGNSKSQQEFYEDLLDDIYVAQSNAVQPDKIGNILSLDSPQPIANVFAKNSTKRDPVKAANARVAANYKCEYDNEHDAFTCKATGENYVEAHHLVPIQLQNKFLYSLDVEANIVALCPMCHRQIHHATNEEKRDIITKLYNDRIERLKKCNIYIELDDLLNFYFGNTSF